MYCVSTTRNGLPSGEDLTVGPVLAPGELVGKVGAAGTVLKAGVVSAARTRDGPDRDDDSCEISRLERLFIHQQPT